MCHPKDAELWHWILKFCSSCNSNFVLKFRYFGRYILWEFANYKVASQGHVPHCMCFNPNYKGSIQHHCQSHWFGAVCSNSLICAPIINLCFFCSQKMHQPISSTVCKFLCRTEIMQGLHRQVLECDTLIMCVTDLASSELSQILWYSVTFSHSYNCINRLVATLYKIIISSKWLDKTL